MLLILATCFALFQEEPVHVWWEGEATIETNFSNSSWLGGNRLKNSHELSNGE